MTQVRIVEELSRLDGSVGWCVMIAAAASYVPGFLAPDVAARWFGAPDACLAGQLAPDRAGRSAWTAATGSTAGSASPAAAATPR